MKAFILESGYSRGALAAARALHDAGYIVGVGAPVRGLSARSRASTRWHALPPLRDRRFTRSLEDICRTYTYDVVFAAGDAELLALSRARDGLTASVPYPPHDVILATMDKLLLSQAAEAAGLAAPLTVEATADAVATWTGACVVKTRLHAPEAEAPEAADRFEARFANSLSERQEIVAEMQGSGFRPLLQEVVGGSLSALVLVIDRSGGVVAAMQQSADRVWPIPAGISVAARTVPPDPALVNGSARLLRSLGWYGLAQLQFLIPPGGSPRLIDVNGRFYGSMALAHEAGLNLPALCTTVADGDEPERVEAAIGARYQWLEGDLRRAFEQSGSHVLRDVGRSVRFAFGARHSIWDARDPRPFFHYLRHLGMRALHKGRSLIRG